MSFFWQKIKDIVNQNIVYEGVTNLPHEVVCLLNKKGLSLTISEHFTAGLVSQQLNNAGALIKSSQYLVADRATSLSELSRKAIEEKQHYGSDLSLVVGVKEGQYVYLALSTPDVSYAICFNYNSHNSSLENQQQTVAMLMLDMLQRWLRGWPVAGHYDWLVVNEMESFYQ